MSYLRFGSGKVFVPKTLPSKGFTFELVEEKEIPLFPHESLNHEEQNNDSLIFEIALATFERKYLEKTFLLPSASQNCIFNGEKITYRFRQNGKMTLFLSGDPQPLRWVFNIIGIHPKDRIVIVVVTKQKFDTIVEEIKKRTFGDDLYLLVYLMNFNDDIVESYVILPKSYDESDFCSLKINRKDVVILPDFESEYVEHDLIKDKFGYFSKSYYFIESPFIDKEIIRKLYEFDGRFNDDIGLKILTNFFFSENWKCDQSRIDYRYQYITKDKPLRLTYIDYLREEANRLFMEPNNLYKQIDYLKEKIAKKLRKFDKDLEFMCDIAISERNDNMKDLVRLEPLLDENNQICTVCYGKENIYITSCIHLVCVDCFRRLKSLDCMICREQMCYLYPLKFSLKGESKKDIITRIAEENTDKVYVVLTRFRTIYEKCWLNEHFNTHLPKNVYVGYNNIIKKPEDFEGDDYKPIVLLLDYASQYFFNMNHPNISEIYCL